MIGVNTEKREATKLEVALLNSPDDCKALQLYGQIALLSRSQPLGATADNFKNRLVVFIVFNVSKIVPQTKKM